MASRLTSRAITHSLLRLRFRTQAKHIRHNQTSATPPRPTTTTAAPKLPPPLTPHLQAALNDITNLTEVQQALTTQDASLRQTLLTRVQAIVAKPHPPASDHLTIAHALLARHAHIIGDVDQERAHLLNVIQTLTDLTARASAQSDDYQSHLACAHLSLSLCCLRAAHKPEMRLAATAAANSADGLSTCPHPRLTSILLSAVTAAPSRQDLLLTALTNTTEDSQRMPQAQLPDALGFASYFLTHACLRIGDLPRAEDHALALVVRWDGARHDFVEALVQAARIVRRKRAEDGWSLAEDLLQRAVKEAARVGNDADKGEPLLEMALLSLEKRSVIEAEGFFRAVEASLQPMYDRMAFTPASADLYVRAMYQFAQFLYKASVDGRRRSSEADEKMQRVAAVRNIFPQILVEDQHTYVPLWFVQSLVPYFNLPLPL